MASDAGTAPPAIGVAPAAFDETLYTGGAVTRTARATHDLKTRQPLASLTLAFAPELLGVDVEARPTSYRWDFGDGTVITTRSPGRPYPQRSPVRHTYERSSAGHSDGYREQDQRDHLHVAGKGRWQPAPNTRVDVSGSWAVDRHDVPLSWCSRGECDDRGQVFQPFKVDTTELGARTDSRKGYIAAQVRQTVSTRIAWVARGSWLRTHFSDVRRSATEFGVANRFGAEARIEAHPESTRTAVVGAEATFSDVTSDIFGSHSQSELAAYGQSDQRVGPVRVSGGARLDFMTVDGGSLTAFVSPRIGITLPTDRRARDGGTLRASAGRGFRERRAPCGTKAFFVFECYKQDVTDEVVPVTARATRVRREAIDFAAKIVRHSGEAVLKVTQVRSVIGSKPKQRATMRALGLRRIGQMVEHADRRDLVIGIHRQCQHGAMPRRARRHKSGKRSAVRVRAASTFRRPRTGSERVALTGPGSAATSPHPICGSNSVVECHLAKVDVEGSNPFSRSEKSQVKVSRLEQMLSQLFRSEHHSTVPEHHLALRLSLARAPS